jgi:hypothetical protein
MPDLLSTAVSAPHPAAFSIWAQVLPPASDADPFLPANLPVGHRLIGASAAARAVLQIAEAPVRGLRGASSCGERAGRIMLERCERWCIWASSFRDRDACRSEGAA